MCAKSHNTISAETIITHWLSSSSRSVFWRKLNFFHICECEPWLRADCIGAKIAIAWASFYFRLKVDFIFMRIMFYRAFTCHIATAEIWIISFGQGWRESEWTRKVHGRRLKQSNFIFFRLFVYDCGCCRDDCFCRRLLLNADAVIVIVDAAAQCYRRQGKNIWRVKALLRWKIRTNIWITFILSCFLRTYANIYIYLFLLVAPAAHSGGVATHLMIRRRFLWQSHRRESAPPSS